MRNKNNLSFLLYRELSILMIIVYCMITSAAVLIASETRANTISGAQKEELLYLLQQDCGSCHGLTLKGGLGSALTKEALKDKSVEYLFATIKYGRSGTAMPPWKDILNTEQINYLAAYLLSEENRLKQASSQSKEQNSFKAIEK